MPAGDAQTYQYIELSDFSQGIHSDFFSGGGGGGTMPTPDNAAQVNGTWGCVAAPTGGLIPAPAKVRTLTETVFDTPFSPGYYPAQDMNVHIGAFKVVSPVDSSTVGSINPPNYASYPVHNSALFYAHQYWFDSAGKSFSAGSTGKAKERVRLYKVAIGDSPNAYTSFAIAPYTGFYPPPTYDLASSTFTYMGSVPLFDGNTTCYGLAQFGVSRSNHPNSTDPGGVVVGFLDAFLIRTNMLFYPSIATPNTDSVDTFSFSGTGVGNMFDTRLMVGHQNRFVVAGASYATASFSTSQFGPMFISGPESLIYTNPNDNQTFTTSTASVFSPEQPGGIGSMYSMNASTLIVVKAGGSGGGYVVNGDVNNPNITQLPGLPSCMGIGNEGTIANSASFIYGSRSGVYAWAGGTNAANISPQLDGWFWHTPWMEQHQGNRAKFAYVYPFIWAPGNWIADVRITNNVTGASPWWKLTSPTDVINTYWDVQAPSMNAEVPMQGPCAIGAPNVWNPAQPVIGTWFNPELGQPYYTWTSHPYQKTMGRVLQVRELDCTLQGVGTVTVQLTGLNGVQTAPATIAINSPNQPRSVNTMLGGPGSQMHDPIVNIQSASSDGVNAAPRWIRGRIGYREIVTAR